METKFGTLEKMKKSDWNQSWWNFSEEQLCTPVLDHERDEEI